MNLHGHASPYAQFRSEPDENTFGVRDPDGLLKRMNSAFIEHRLSRKKRNTFFERYIAKQNRFAEWRTKADCG
jgi:hypothetical protein